MTTISHRELRTNPGEILRRVAAGESFDITDHGRVVAVIGPKPRSVLDELRAAGQVRDATAPRSALRDIERIVSDVSSEEMIRDLRGK